MPTAIALCTPVSDYIIHTNRMPHPERISKLLDHSWQFGGNAATAIVAASRQGVSAGIIGVVGDDANGSAQRLDFKRHGVDISHLITREGMDTCFCICISEKETKDRSFISSGSKITPVTPSELDMDYLLSAQYLLLDQNTEATRLAAKSMLEQGKEVMFDASLYREEMEKMLPLTSIYITSEYYWKQRYDQADIFDCCRDMQKQGPHTVIFTLGDQGCAGIGPQGAFQLDAIPVPEVVDTTGAGDTFHGAYVVGLERGLDCIESARWASAAAAIKCTAIGGRAAQPTAKTISNFLETGTPNLSFVPSRVEYYERLHYEEDNASPNSTKAQEDEIHA